MSGPKVLSAAEQFAVLKSGTVEIVPEEEFRQKLERSVREGRPLRVKQGFDPTAPDIHLGHTIGLMKLKQFQDLGHQIVLIVGDYTAQVGDPSERSETRPRLAPDVVRKNAQTYLDQFGKVLDMARTEVRWNGEWFGKLAFHEVMELAAQFTVARILERDDFLERYKAGRPISLHEFFYIVMQAYDSVMIRADVELGATEQKFNLLAGRDLQRARGQEPQVALTLPVLSGTDGTRRMSKSTGNYIGVAEPPYDQFGKVMSISDATMREWYPLLSGMPHSEQDRLLAPDAHPMNAKYELAWGIVSRFHGREAADTARDRFRKEHSEGQLPPDIEPWTPTEEELRKISVASDRELPPVLFSEGIQIACTIVRGLVRAVTRESANETTRLIRQGAVEILQGGVWTKLLDPIDTVNIYDGDILRVGKRRYFRLRPAKQR